MKFRYKDRVIVTNGFYKGLCGVVFSYEVQNVGIFKPKISYIYDVQLVNNGEPGEILRFKEDNLEFLK